MSKENSPKIRTRIGGQSVMEGIMMRGMTKSVLACRLPDGTIDTEEMPCTNLANPPWYRKIPIVRGVVGYVESLYFGYKCLMRSAEKQDMLNEEDETPEEKKGWLDKKLENTSNEKLFNIIMVIGTVIGVVIAVLLFMMVPALIVKGIEHFSGELPRIVKSLIEGCIKILLLVGYMYGVSFMKEIATTFQYHGAEHKSIFCYEAGDELTVENVRKYRRFHPRCGTSFLIIILLVSILVYAVVTWENLVVRIILKTLLLPVVVGVSYEIIQFAGRHDNLLTRIISAPGMWLQHITVKEPTDEQIEVALAALKPVLPENPGEDAW